MKEIISLKISYVAGCALKAFITQLFLPYTVSQLIHRFSRPTGYMLVEYAICSNDYSDKTVCNGFGEFAVHFS